MNIDYKERNALIKVAEAAALVLDIYYASRPQHGSKVISALEKALSELDEVIK